MLVSNICELSFDSISIHLIYKGAVNSDEDGDEGQKDDDKEDEDDEDSEPGSDEENEDEPIEEDNEEEIKVKQCHFP